VPNVETKVIARCLDMSKRDASPSLGGSREDCQRKQCRDLKGKADFCQIAESRRAFPCGLEREAAEVKTGQIACEGVSTAV
jgi:hypothetical protein